METCPIGMTNFQFITKNVEEMGLLLFNPNKLIVDKQCQNQRLPFVILMVKISQNHRDMNSNVRTK